MLEEDIEIPMKVLIVGNGAVGKSSMIQRYCKGVYTNDYKKTIGVDFLEKKLSVGGEDLRLMIWDTAGQEEFDAITKSYYRGAAGCVIAFSTTDRDSFDAVENWIRKVEDEVQNVPMVLVQNKIDLVDQAVMTPEEANAKAEAIKLAFYRTSVMENFKVTEVFEYLAQKYLEKRRAETAAAKKAAPKNSNFEDGPSKGGASEAAKPNFQQPAAGIRLDQPSKSRGAKKKNSLMAGCSLL